MNPDAFLPLSAPTYAVLLTLGERSLHGYGIIRAFEARTGQVDTLLPGSLYNTVARMLQQNLLEEVPPPPEEEDGRKRYYRATVPGRAVARAETQRLEALLGFARERGLAG